MKFLKELTKWILHSSSLVIHLGEYFASYDQLYC